MATATFFRGRKEGGATLVVALILLALMTVMGVFAARSAIFQEKSSANDLDRSMAMQAAEIALRDAERDIQGLQADGNPCTGANCRIAALYVDGLLSNGFVLACTSAMCEGDADVPATAHVAVKPWDGVAIPTIWTDPALYATYGQYTGNPPDVANIPAAQQPRYIIEKFTRTYESASRPVYRITALGFGRNADTQVLLQSIFVPQ